MKGIIYKYPIKITEEPTYLELPLDARFLSAIEQNNKIIAYVQQSIDLMHKAQYMVRIVGTGQVFDTYMWVFFATVKQGSFVWHLYWKRV